MEMKGGNSTHTVCMTQFPTKPGAKKSGHVALVGLNVGVYKFDKIYLFFKSLRLRMSGLN